MSNAGRPTILIATDFMPASRSAFDSGVLMAKAAGGRVLLVHAVRPLGAPGLEQMRPDTSGAENETMEPASDIESTSSLWAAAAGALGVPTEVVVRAGLPATVIVEEADRVDAHTVVLGASTKSGFSKVAFGSVATDVKRGTTRPVVVLPRA